MVECSKFLCKSNLKNDLLNKIYVSENGDSLNENNHLEIQKHSLNSSVSTPNSIARVIDIKLLAMNKNSIELQVT